MTSLNDTAPPSLIPHSWNFWVGGGRWWPGLYLLREELKTSLRTLHCVLCCSGWGGGFTPSGAYNLLTVGLVENSKERKLFASSRTSYKMASVFDPKHRSGVILVLVFSSTDPRLCAERTFRSSQKLSGSSRWGFWCELRFDTTFRSLVIPFFVFWLFVYGPRFVCWKNLSEPITS